MREFLPTVEVSRGLGAPVPLPVALDGSIDAIRFTPTGARAPMTWKASLAANYTDGLVVLHRGRVVYEFYAGELREDRSHAAMSVAKSLTGTLAAMLAAEGVIEPAAPVTRYVPELAGSAFVTARITPIRKRKSGSTPRPAIHCRSLVRR
ncbi:serine hydrolase [Pseudoxanthomonas mexicana]